MKENKKIKKRIILSLFVLLVACACLYYLKTFEQAPLPDDQPLEAGSYIVGKDLEAGEYILFTDTEGYFEIRAEQSNRIRSNDNFRGNSIVTVHENETIDLSKAILYPYAEAPEIKTDADGMYKIGEHLDAGTYKIKTDLSGYYEISSSSEHAIDDVIENNNFTDTYTIHVKEGEYLKLNGAYFVTKVQS
ncbi:hypothetical protein [Erysipelothrix tonsillarum]|uniref:hypothetical protein n=1 Tax=Erysipelothrix tonsillarum TaxID=38402 RepID=UPI00037E2E43|nr:hypothetical protein [Erysipelothrix tonsillarum]